jgi:hypothetical protein
MFASELERLVAEYPQVKNNFLGCFGIDEVSEIPFKPGHFAILNRDKKCM